MAELHVHRLGLVEYDNGLKLQSLFGQARAKGDIPDTLLLLEHPPVLTLGRAAKRVNVLASEEELSGQGVGLFETNRGGDVTYHGPGQLVGYPILKLEGKRQDVRAYVRALEEALIRTLADFGITAGRIPEWTGVWVGDKGAPPTAKIAAIGVHLSRWQTSHGFALNVNTHLPHFGLIVPCGIREAGVTSMQKQLGHPVDFEMVQDAMVRHLASLFESTASVQTVRHKSVSVAVTRGEKLLCLRRVKERGGFWQLVTGRIEGDESPLVAAVRELQEETGRSSDVLPLGYEHAFALGEEAPPSVFRETAFKAKWPEGQDPQLSDEHDAYAWVDLKEAESLLPFSGLRRAARMALNPRSPE
jgi:lipoyl(octanoyl) transferase